MSEKEGEERLFSVLSKIAGELEELNVNIKRLAEVQEKRAAFRKQHPRFERNMGGEEERGGRYGRSRTMYKVTCSDCGKEMEIPFKLTRGRPVYCRNCFRKHRR